MKLQTGFLNTLFQKNTAQKTDAGSGLQGSAASKGTDGKSMGLLAVQPDNMVGGVNISGTSSAGNSSGASGTGSSESDAIIQQLKDQGYTLTKDQQDKISDFVKEVNGTPEDKMKAVRTALDKNLPINGNVLRAVYGAFSGEALGKLGTELSAELSAEGMAPCLEAKEFFNAVLDAVLKDSSGVTGDSEVLNQISESADLEAVIQLITKNSASLLTTEELAGDLSGEVSGEAMVKSLMAELSEIMGQVFESLSEETPEKPTAKTESASPVVSNKSTELPVAPKPLEAMKTQEPAPAHPMEPPSPIQLEDTAEKTDPNPSADYTSKTNTQGDAVSNADEGSDASPTYPAAVQGLLMVIREITPEIQAVKTQYTQERNKVLDSIRKVSESLSNPTPMVTQKQEQKDTLDKAIDRLDNLILKSDVPLYTSMKTEKGLLAASSTLQDARNRLYEGDTNGAKTLLNQVEKDLKELIFQPSKQKIVHVASERAALGVGDSTQSLKDRVQLQLEKLLEPATTARGVLEGIRTMGLEHEAEVASNLGNGIKKSGTESWEPKETLRHVLLELAKETEKNMQTVTAAEKTLNNLTGQQLLNRPEGKSQGQTMFFSVPMQMADRVEDLKIYVQSRKDQNKIDWENCTFYFAVNTDGYGEVGIGLTAVRKTVSVQVKCNSKELQEALEPIAKDFQNAMGEIGYKIAGISYSRLSESKAAESSQEAVQEIESDGKGLNVRV